MESKLDFMDYFEFMDRTAILQGNVETSIMDHQILEANKELADKVEKLQELLGDIYQTAGELFNKVLDETEQSKGN